MTFICGIFVACPTLTHTHNHTVVQTDAATDVRQMYSSECGKKRTVWKPPNHPSRERFIKCYTDDMKHGLTNGANGPREAEMYLVWFPHLSLSLSLLLLSVHLCHFHTHSLCVTLFLYISIYQQYRRLFFSVVHTNTHAGGQFPRWRGQLSGVSIYTQRHLFSLAKRK